MKPIFHLEHMIDHQKQVLLLLQCCTGMWDLWQLRYILFHQTHKFARSLHQHHHTELEQKHQLSESLFRKNFKRNLFIYGYVSQGSMFTSLCLIEAAACIVHIYWKRSPKKTFWRKTSFDRLTAFQQKNPR